MGKAQSTELGGKANAAQGLSYSPSGAANDSNGGVKLRTQKGTKKTKDKRPASYAGPATSTSAPQGDNIPVFNRSNNNPMLAGRHSQVLDEAAIPSLESIKEVSNHQPSASNAQIPDTFILSARPTTPPGSDLTDGGRPSVAHVPSTGTPSRLLRDSTTQTFRHSRHETSVYERSLDQLITACPKYKDLRSMNIDLLDINVLGSLQDAFTEMLKGYDEVRDYRSEIEVYQRRLDSMTELRERCEVLEETLKKREVEIARLTELVTLLRSSQQDPGYTSGSDDLDYRTKKSDHSQGNATKLSDDSIDLDDSARFKSRVKEGIYKATPLIIAEGEEGSKAVVKRTSSLKPVGLEPRSPGYERPLHPLPDEEPLTPGSGVDDRLRWLERSLERERQENLYLRDRIKAKGSGAPREPIYEVLPRRSGVSPEDMVDRYRRLEEHAVGRLYASIKHHLAQITDKRRSQFICAVIETSYTMALSSVLYFTDTVQGLLNNPIKAHRDSNESSTKSSSSAKPVKDHAKNFDAIKARAGHRARETSASGDLPDLLVKQMTTYLQKMSDVTDISSLIENVCDGLRKNFSDCASSALLNQTDFNQFLSNSCRLAWQMAVATPPLYISTETLRMDDRLHETLMQDEVTNAQIDHYLWPTLFDRRNGSVLYKGRVVIKTFGVNL